MKDQIIEITDLFKEYNLQISEIVAEKESAEYSAHDLKIGDLNIKYRSSKITRTKTGQFVTLWKRTENGTIAPFDNSDSIDYVIINCKKEDNSGIFIFPKYVLIQQNIFTDKKEGKRAFRIYPSWDIAINSQAKKTQKWQLDYFYNFDQNFKNTTLESLFKQ